MEQTIPKTLETSPNTTPSTSSLTIPVPELRPMKLSEIFDKYFSHEAVGQVHVMGYPEPKLKYRHIEAWNFNSPPFTFNDIIIDLLYWKSTNISNWANIYQTISKAKYKTEENTLTLVPIVPSERLTEKDLFFLRCISQAILNGLSYDDSSQIEFFKSYTLKKLNMNPVQMFKMNEGYYPEDILPELGNVRIEQLDPKGVVYWTMFNTHSITKEQMYPDNMKKFPLLFSMIMWSFCAYITGLEIPKTSPINDFDMNSRPEPYDPTKDSSSDEEEENE